MNPALLLDIINKEEEYKVEEIRNHRKQERGTQFLMHYQLELYYTYIYLSKLLLSKITTI